MRDGIAAIACAPIPQRRRSHRRQCSSALPPQTHAASYRVVGGRAMELDAVTLEVLSRKLAAITDEMYFSVQRASRSSYVKEAADFAVALLDVNGEVFAYPPSATFAFLIDTEFKSTIDAVPNMVPGDVIITNDPYTSNGLS